MLCVRELRKPSVSSSGPSALPVDRSLFAVVATAAVATVAVALAPSRVVASPAAFGAVSCTAAPSVLGVCLFLALPEHLGAPVRRRPGQL